jgi:hypothetical protein
LAEKAELVLGRDRRPDDRPSISCAGVRAREWRKVKEALYVSKPDVVTSIIKSAALA